MTCKSEDSYQGYVRARLQGKQGTMSSFFLVAPFLSERRVLDIGCSDGLYLKHFDEESLGIEQSSDLVVRAKSHGLNVIQGNIIEELPKLKHSSFHAVFFSHAMEHLESPILALREIHRLLVSNGVLVLGLPTEKNLFRYVLRKNYFDGTHLYAFSVQNALKLLMSSGFEPTGVFFDLPRCRGQFGRALIRLYQRCPFKEAISMAYWIVAEKRCAF